MTAYEDISILCPRALGPGGLGEAAAVGSRWGEARGPRQQALASGPAWLLGLGPQPQPAPLASSASASWLERA